MKSWIPISAFFILTYPISSSACSLAGCSDKSVEFRPDFAVRVLHQGKALPRVNVQVTTFGEGEKRIVFSGMTGADGTVRVTPLAAGQYWLDVELLDITAASECFHVSPSASRKAKREITYQWGDLAPSTRQIAGKLLDSHPGKGGTPIWNLIHPVDVPITGARLRLQNPLTDAVYRTSSDEDGNFTFVSTPPGTYVLHIDSGRVSEGRDYDATDLLIRLSDRAARDNLVLRRKEAGGGSCGDTSLELSAR